MERFRPSDESSVTEVITPDSVSPPTPEMVGRAKEVVVQANVTSEVLRTHFDRVESNLVAYINSEMSTMRQGLLAIVNGHEAQAEILLERIGEIIEILIDPSMTTDVFRVAPEVAEDAIAAAEAELPVVEDEPGDEEFHRPGADDYSNWEIVTDDDVVSVNTNVGMAYLEGKDSNFFEGAGLASLDDVDPKGILDRKVYASIDDLEESPDPEFSNFEWTVATECARGDLKWADLMRAAKGPTRASQLKKRFEGSS